MYGNPNFCIFRNLEFIYSLHKKSVDSRKLTFCLDCSICSILAESLSSVKTPTYSLQHIQKKEKAGIDHCILASMYNRKKKYLTRD